MNVETVDCLGFEVGKWFHNYSECQCFLFSIPLLPSFFISILMVRFNEGIRI